jgi:hypothetical protein
MINYMQTQHGTKLSLLEQISMTLRLQNKNCPDQQVSSINELNNKWSILQNWNAPAHRSRASHAK